MEIFSCNFLISIESIKIISQIISSQYNKIVKNQIIIIYCIFFRNMLVFSQHLILSHLNLMFFFHTCSYDKYLL